MPKAHWSLLTKSLIEKGKITTGLTIPYLYGSYKRLGYEIGTIEDLLEEITKVRSDDIPIIEKCDKIKFDVVKPESKTLANKSRKKDDWVKIDDYPMPLIISYNTNLGKEKKKIANSLKALYQIFIDAETYSWNQVKGEW